MEPSDEEVMRRPPRDPQEAILSRAFLGSILFYGGLITVSTLATFVWALGTGSHARATTIAFMTLALAQIFHLGNARSGTAVLGIARATGNPYAVGAVALSIGLQLVALAVPPIAQVLRLSPLAMSDWVVVVAAAAFPAVIGQAIKLRRSLSDADGGH
jgi:Ca2+-transporting ATPase